MLRSRATDEKGETQPTTVELAKFLNITMDWMKTPSGIFGNFRLNSNTATKPRRECRRKCAVLVVLPYWQRCCEPRMYCVVA